jgi:hypothetical protein
MSEDQGFRVSPDGTIWPVDAVDVAAGLGVDLAGAVGGWPPAVELAPARAAWRIRLADVLAAHTLALSAHASLSRVLAVLAEAVEAERRAWDAYGAVLGWDEPT